MMNSGNNVCIVGCGYVGLTLGVVLADHGLKVFGVEKVDGKEYTKKKNQKMSNVIEELIKEKPERMLYLSVKRMLPKNKMSSRQILRLKMYKGSTHPPWRSPLQAEDPAGPNAGRRRSLQDGLLQAQRGL